MKQKQLVLEAKKGNKKAFDELIKYYEDYFVDKVLKNNDNNKKLEEEAKILLPKLLKIYFEKNYTQSLCDYLRYYSASYFAYKKRIDNIKDIDMDCLKGIYSKRVFKYFRELKSILSDKELEKFSYNLISNVLDTFSEDRESLSANFAIFFSRQKRFINSDESLIIRYVIQEGINDNIIKYFEKKYVFILEDYKMDVSYAYLNKNFKYIIIDALNELSINKTNIKAIIKRKVHKMKSDYKKEITEVGLNVRKDSSRKEELYEANLVLKQRVYDLYKDKVPADKINEIIDEKYDLYFDAYINGVCTKTLSSYILTRFKEYFDKRKLPRQLTKQELEIKESIYYENEKLIDKKLEKASLNYPHCMVKEELINCYNEAIDTYFIKESKTDFSIIAGYKLREKLEKLAELYSDDNIINTSLNMKESILLNKIQNGEIVDEIIDNLTEYYISNKMNNEKPFELFIIDAIETFDIEEYLMIKDVKEHVNLKVLKRSKKR